MAEIGRPKPVRGSESICVIETGDAFVVSSNTLNQIVAPTGSVDFSQQQALQFRIENRTSDPASPAVGEIWLRTDL